MTASRNVCLFCLHRLVNRERSAFFYKTHRTFAKTAWRAQQAGQSSAQASFPDPDLPQQPLRPPPPPPRAQTRAAPERSHEVVASSNSSNSPRIKREYNFGIKYPGDPSPANSGRQDAYETTAAPKRGHEDVASSDHSTSPLIKREYNTVFKHQGDPFPANAGRQDAYETSEWGHLRRRQKTLDNGDEQSGNSRLIRKSGTAARPRGPDRLRKLGYSGLDTEPSDNAFASRFTGKSGGPELGRERTSLPRSGLHPHQQRATMNPDTPSNSGFPPAQRSSELPEFHGEDLQAASRFESQFRQSRTSSISEQRTIIPEQSSINEQTRENVYSRINSSIPEERTMNDQSRGKIYSRTYDATPRRRRRDDKTSRRAEKFDLEGEEENFEEDQEANYRKALKKQRHREREEAAKEVQDKTILIPAFISVANFATSLKVRVEEFVEKLESLGFEDVANDHVLGFEDASLVAMEYNRQPIADRSDGEDLKPRPPPTDLSVVPQRPPVVTIMGHVDHGKTTLLDYLRKSSVASQEHGGITQHIGAFSVPMASGKLITFLDTPGHAAFLSMRERGANVTDIVILVVAADDSVKPQTIEAIKHAKAAKVPIIVAINKVDKDEADIERVKQDLMRHEVEVEDFGGDVQAYPVSGKTGQGLDELVEAMTTQAEILDMRAETDGPSEGWVLEASKKREGRIATVLVRRGTLRPGNIIVAGTTWARVRTLKNEAGLEVEEALPGTPVEVDGWRDQPSAGDEVLEAENEQKATDVVDYRNYRLTQAQAAIDMEAINEQRRIEAARREREKEERERIAAGDLETKTKAAASKQDEETELCFIIKTDVSGSAEAIEGFLATLPLSKYPIRLNILRAAVGAVSEFDIDHISTVPSGEGFIISFNQQVPPNISAQAQKAGVRILDENIIYKVNDKVREIVESKLAPIITKRVLGEAEAAQAFDITLQGRKTTRVAGCKVRNGVMSKNNKIRVYRGSVGNDANIVYDGTMSTLKSHKKDVLEMRKGTECGIAFKDWEGFLPGDILQCYEELSEPRRLT